MINRLGVDLAPNNISKYEHDLNEPPTDVMLAYARLARVPLEQLVDDQLDLVEFTKRCVSPTTDVV
jgi:transcriptional regulator with XRE-family HTH domain